MNPKTIFNNYTHTYFETGQYIEKASLQQMTEENLPLRLVKQ